MGEGRKSRGDEGGGWVIIERAVLTGWGRVERTEFCCCTVEITNVKITI